jgi:hypothetical protein
MIGKGIYAVTRKPLVISSCLAFVLGLLIVSGIGAQEAKNVAVILKTARTCELLKGEAQDWEEATKGKVLDSGDGLRTGSRSFMSIVFQDDMSQLKLNENSELRISGTREEENVSKKLWLGVGNMWVNVTKREAQDFQVETPTAVASVIGSDGSFDVAGNGYTGLDVGSGLFGFSNDFGSVQVGEGQSAFSNGKQPPFKSSKPLRTMLIKYKNVAGADREIEIKFLEQ